MRSKIGVRKLYSHFVQKRSGKHIERYQYRNKILGEKGFLA